MRVAVVHYHLQPGGVTRVIQHAAEALAAHDVSVVVLAGDPPQCEWPVPVRVVPGLRYEERRPGLDGAALELALLEAARDALGAPADLWHVHNHSLGKNLALPDTLSRMAAAGRPLLLQLHDFPEDGRPASYRRLLAQLGGGDPQRLVDILYPQGARVHYAVLNGRDEAVLRAAGFAAQRLESLPNPLGLDVGPVQTGAVIEQRRMWLYPTRAIRRKNLGEFLLWALLGDRGDRFATTLAPTNPLERSVYERWVALAAELRLPLEFELGTRSSLSFPQLLRSAHAIVTTSVAEGFGMAFLEPWLVGRAIAGRDLPEITGGFREAGVRFPGLYERLDVPLAWVGEDALREHGRVGLARLLEGYGRRLPAGYLDAALDAWVRDGGVDFGRLDEPLQEVVLCRLAGSLEARQELTLPVVGNSDELAETNRRVVCEHFGLDAYGQRLHHLYRQAIDSTFEPVQAISAGAILDQFLAPEHTVLLRT